MEPLEPRCAGDKDIGEEYGQQRRLLAKFVGSQFGVVLGDPRQKLFFLGADPRRAIVGIEPPSREGVFEHGNVVDGQGIRRLCQNAVGPANRGLGWCLGPSLER
ncbi:MAG TPA: hypothetical protein PK867_26280, partial [Pirellulales bacterium]|nr:hypothetical protein [Pirellulales bacterium]